MDEEYELGENVTDLARSQKGDSGCVLSIRVDLELLAAIERIANAEDRSLSFVARRALRAALGLKNEPSQRPIALTEVPQLLTHGSGGSHNFYMPAGQQ